MEVKIPKRRVGETAQVISDLIDDHNRYQIKHGPLHRVYRFSNSPLYGIKRDKEFFASRNLAEAIEVCELYNKQEKLAICYLPEGEDIPLDYKPERI